MPSPVQAALGRTAALDVRNNNLRAALHCCRYADEEGVSDDEDMLRAFWSDDEGEWACLPAGPAACLAAGLPWAGWSLGRLWHVSSVARRPPTLLACCCHLPASAAEGVALSDLEDEEAGGRRNRSRRGGGGGRVSRQGSGAASRLQRNAACVKARHNVITAFNPVTQVGGGLVCLAQRVAGQGQPRRMRGAALAPQAPDR